VQFAIYCAELALPIFEGKYPDDKRPRRAIQTAKAWLKKPNQKNRVIAANAAEAARDWAAWAAYSARTVGDDQISDLIVDYGIKLLKI
jgi:hypothetical protein